MVDNGAADRSDETADGANPISKQIILDEEARDHTVNHNNVEATSAAFRLSSNEETRSVILETQRIVDSLLAARPGSVRVLEAGCGSGSNMQLPANRHVVGVDISADELDKNPLVDEKIVGDLQTIALPVNSFDLVVCWDVLEHLSNPEPAIESLLSAARPGGLVLLAFPNVLSIKGLVAKVTPIWFHWAVYRVIYGKRYKEDGVAIFPTYLRWSIMPVRVVRMALEHRFEVVVRRVYESGVQRRFARKLMLTPTLGRLLDRLVRLLSLNQATWTGSDCILLLRKLD